MLKMTRSEHFKQALIFAVYVCGYRVSATGMYRCEEYEYINPSDIPCGLTDVQNVCAICLFITNAPYNFGDNIEPTSCDGNCDNCNNPSLFYSYEENIHD